MAAWGSFDYSEFIALRDKIERLKNFDLDAFCMQITRELGQILFDDVGKRMPVDTGELKRKWIVNRVGKNGSMYEVKIINPLEYAEFVEFGHRKRNNRGWVKGFFMLTLAERDLQRNMENIIREKVEALLNEVLNDG